MFVAYHVLLTQASKNQCLLIYLSPWTKFLLILSSHVHKSFCWPASQWPMPPHYEIFIWFLFFLHFFWPTVSLIYLWHTLSWAACHLTSGCQHLYSTLFTWCYKILHKPIDGNIFIKHLHILLLVKFILNYIITFSTTNGIDFAYLRP